MTTNFFIVFLRYEISFAGNSNSKVGRNVQPLALPSRTDLRLTSAGWRRDFADGFFVQET
jgi:hypothetical protein